MKSLKFVWKNKKIAGVLWLQELFLALALFVFFNSWVSSVSGSTRFAYCISPLDFIVQLTTGKTFALITPIIMIWIALFLIVRLFLSGGVFHSLANGWQGIGPFITQSAKFVLRFLAVLLILAIPGLLLSAFLNMGLSRLTEVDHTRWAFYLGLGQRYIMFLFLALISYFNALNRWKMVTSGKFALSLHASFRRMMAFVGYSTLALLTLSASLLLGFLLLHSASSGSILLALLLFLVGLFIKNLFQLAACKSAEP